MTVFYAPEIAKVIPGSGTAGTPAQGFYNATPRTSTAVVTMAAQATTDTIVVGLIPKGSVFLYGVLNASATMGGTATVAIGITGATGKYRAAAVYAAAAPEVFGVGAAAGVAETADRVVFVTIAAAALPAGGSFSVTLFYTQN
jgi:hypothetical protein